MINWIDAYINIEKYNWRFYHYWEKNPMLNLIDAFIIIGKHFSMLNCWETFSNAKSYLALENVSQKR